MTQVLVNILKNAVEAMEESGEIKVHAYLQRNHVVIDVSDTGAGMSPDQISKLGNLYYSTKDKGTGLGLMVTFRIIEALRGKIKVTSERSQGTTFSLIIPAAAKPMSSN